MLFEALSVAVIETVAGRGLDRIMQLIGNRAPQGIRVDVSRVREALLDHLQMVARWSNDISFHDLLRAKELRESFVNIDCELGLFETLTNTPRTSPAVRKVTELLNENGHLIILGRPGAGKTTTLQRLAQLAAGRRELGVPTFPILLRLRDLSHTASLVGTLCSTLGLHITSTDSDDRDELGSFQRRILTQYLDKIGALLLIDGLDEAPSAQRDSIERDIQELLFHANTCRVVVTCRTADYRYVFGAAQAYTLLPLRPEQINIFASRWLGDQAAAFIDQLYSSPFAGIEVLPLTMAHLCAIYERRKAIPNKPKSVYQKVIRLVLEEWDEQRSISRESAYADFDIDRKEEFLRHVAYELTKQGKRASFSHADLEAAYLNIYRTFNLPRTEAGRVAREIESHTGLILHSSNDQYEFAHRSLQEYLAAEYILRLPQVPAFLLLLPEEMAVATALSSNPGSYLESIFGTLDSAGSDSERRMFTKVFFQRLVAEKPDFIPSPRLGWIGLAFADLLANERSGEIVRGDLEQLGRLRTLLVSMLLAYQMAHRERVNESLELVYPEDATPGGDLIKRETVPESVKRYFARRRNGAANMVGSITEVLNALGGPPSSTHR
jgi:hypothetical protein